ncbi:MAG: DUF1801 domain-containing protein [Pseudomonadota bacterium]
MNDRFDELEALIVEAAAEVPEVGEIAETMKWGQPSFTPVKADIGSSVRIERREDGDFALMFICTTGLVDQFRELYPDQLAYEGSRAIKIGRGGLPTRSILKHCIQLALTHKLRRRKRR